MPWYSLYSCSYTIYTYQLLHTCVHKEASGLTWIPLSLLTSAVLLFFPCCFLLKEAKKAAFKSFVFSFANPAPLSVPEQREFPARHHAQSLGSQKGFNSFQDRSEHFALNRNEIGHRFKHNSRSSEFTEINLKLSFSTAEILILSLII